MVSWFYMIIVGGSFLMSLMCGTALLVFSLLISIYKNSKKYSSLNKALKVKCVALNCDGSKANLVKIVLSGLDMRSKIYAISSTLVSILYLIYVFIHAYDGYDFTSVVSENFDQRIVFMITVVMMLVCIASAILIYLQSIFFYACIAYVTLNEGLCLVDIKDCSLVNYGVDGSGKGVA